MWDFLKDFLYKITSHWHLSRRQFWGINKKWQQQNFRHNLFTEIREFLQHKIFVFVCSKMCTRKWEIGSSNRSIMFVYCKFSLFCVGQKFSPDFTWTSELFLFFTDWLASPWSTFSKQNESRNIYVTGRFFSAMLCYAMLYHETIM